MRPLKLDPKALDVYRRNQDQPWSPAPMLDEIEIRELAGRLEKASCG